ncbi:MAG: alpha/beta hydrolase [Opitutaceae bacterium]|nr:alpha/beta hydrolase [Opitutaceae bacterium]
MVAGTARTLPRPDLVLHYKDYGRGEPVLVLAGGPGQSGEHVEPLAQIIARRARAVLPDQRGTGSSMPNEAAAITLDATVADLEALRTALGLRNWTVVGHSWGGMLALEYAAKLPGSIKGLVLVASGGASFASFGKAYNDNAMVRMSQDSRTALDYWSQPAVVAKDPARAAIERFRAFAHSAFYDRAKANEWIAMLTPGKEHFNPEAAKYLRPAYEQGAAVRAAALRDVQIPALIVHGRQDPMPESVALENQSLLKGSRLVWLDRCGHLPFLEQPDALEKALVEFLFPQGQ